MITYFASSIDNGSMSGADSEFTKSSSRKPVEDMILRSFGDDEVERKDDDEMILAGSSLTCTCARSDPREPRTMYV